MIKDNALKSLGECIALLWLIETVNYLLLLLLSELTVFSIAEICVQRTLMNDIILMLCFCFVLPCSSF